MYKGTFNNRMKAPKIFNDNLYVLFRVVTFNEVIRPTARHKKMQYSTRYTTRPRIKKYTRRKPAIIKSGIIQINLWGSINNRINIINIKPQTTVYD